MRVHLSHLWVVFSLLACWEHQANAHSMLPAYLIIHEGEGNNVSLLLKSPIIAGRDPGLRVSHPSHCRRNGTISTRPSDKATVRQWSLQCKGGIRGSSFQIIGLSAAVSETIVNIRRSDKSQQMVVVHRAKPNFQISPGKATPAFWSYLLMGVEHILLGLDHLLFVLGLLLVVRVRNEWMEPGNNHWMLLLSTITAFTVAHSLTLGLAVLGYVKLSPEPVELVIAMSILLLGFELGLCATKPDTLTFRKPWLVSFGFGLLHGFGFAGALAQIGLPETSVAPVLLLFNLGVELGQILFVGVILLSTFLLRSILSFVPPSLGLAFNQRTVVYGLVSVSSYWCAERVVALLF